LGTKLRGHAEPHAEERSSAPFIDASTVSPLMPRSSIGLAFAITGAILAGFALVAPSATGTITQHPIGALD
jgi:hypothetical protein